MDKDCTLTENATCKKTKQNNSGEVKEKRSDEEVGGYCGYLWLHRTVHGGRLGRRVPVGVGRLGARRHRRLLWFGLSCLRRALDVLAVPLISLEGHTHTHRGA